MVNSREKWIAKTRMEELFSLAVGDEKAGNYVDAKRKYDLIFLYSTRYKSRIPGSAKTWICKKCKSGIYSSGGYIRINKSMVIIHCGNCGYVRRFPISLQ
jgi:RNase P subunit RPR2